jgi:hypothetical protein
MAGRVAKSQLVLQRDLLSTQRRRERRDTTHQVLLHDTPVATAFVAWLNRLFA